MSQPSHIGNREIGSKEELVAWFRQNCVPGETLRTGVEHEKPPFYLEDHEPVPYHGKKGRPGIKDLFERMVREHGWHAQYEGGNIIGLSKGGVSWTLEPGGQMETSGAPAYSVHEIAAETDSVLSEITAVARDFGMGILAQGYHPTHEGRGMFMIPKSRFRAFFNRTVRKDKGHGFDGLSCTSAIQVSLGYKSEEDMIKKLRVALSLQPIVIAMYANSPFKGGAPSGYESYRSHVMHNYMDGRFGFMMPIAFEEDFNFEKFVDYVMNDVPLMGIYDGDTFVDVQGGTFKEFMEGKLAACPGRKATFADWENHLNTIWPEVRLRRFLEMRGADSGPPEMIKALPAFWAGILYDEQALDAAYEIVRHWTNEDREYLRRKTPETGLQTPFMGGATTVQEMAKQFLALSEEGLKRRALKDAQDHDESAYLAPLKEIAASGRNWAQRLLARFHGKWKGDIHPLFEDMDFRHNPSVFNPEEDDNRPGTPPPAPKP